MAVSFWITDACACTSTRSREWWKYNSAAPGYSGPYLPRSRRHTPTGRRRGTFPWTSCPARWQTQVLSRTACRIRFELFAGNAHNKWLLLRALSVHEQTSGIFALSSLQIAFR
jgi:hypothetical protein